VIVAAAVVGVMLFIFSFHVFMIVGGVLFLILIVYFAIDAFR